MERTRWTDERLDDFAGEVRGLRGDIAALETRLRSDIRDLQQEVHAGDERIATDVSGLKTTLITGAIAIIITLIAFVG